MLLRIPCLLTPDEVRHCRQALEAASWQDGKTTAGHVAAQVKSNLQLPLDSKTGHNNYGRITTRHRGGGHKRRYRFIDFLRDNERSVDMLLRFPRKAGMADDEYRTFLIDKINDVVLGESREGYILREHLRQMERLPRRGYRTPRGLKADKAAWERVRKVGAFFSGAMKRSRR